MFEGMTDLGERWILRFAAIALLVVGTATVVGCKGDAADDDGPAENAAESVSEGAEDTGEAVDEAVDDATD